MFSAEDNEILCRVEGETPMAQLMRKHWIPVCMSQELPAPKSDPIKVKLLGKSYVAFRDAQGQAGVLDEACPHRRASLYYGRVEDGGLRCLFHGWQFDAAGRIVDMPSEPQGSKAAQHIKLRGYECREAGGLIWVYLGDSSDSPAFAPPAFASGSNAKVSIAKVVVNANWAQVVEGGIDSSHSSSLHSDEMKGDASAEKARISVSERHGVSTAYTAKRPSVDKAPRLQAQSTDYGMRYVALRQPIHDPDLLDYARISVYIAPFTVMIPPNSSFSMVQYLTPMDDEHTMFHFVAWSDDSLPGDGIDQELWRARSGARVGIDVDENYRNLRTLQNRHMQDREAMRRGSFSGIAGTGNQDIAMWESMGPVTDRSEESLVTGDVAVAHFRRLMVQAARRVQAGEEAIGTIAPHADWSQIRGFEGLISKGQDWKDLGLGPIDWQHLGK